MKRLLKRLHADITASLPAKFDLIYIDRGDQLSDEQAGFIVARDDESLWESFESWESDSRHHGAVYEADEAVTGAVRDWERADDEDYTDVADEYKNSEHYQTLLDTIKDRDDGSWFRELVNATPGVLCRATIVGEDNAFNTFGSNEFTTDAFLLECGLPLTTHNMRVMTETLVNVPSDIFMAQVIVGVDLTDWLDTDANVKRLVVERPHLMIGNIWTGATWISEDPFEGSVVIDANDLKTDKASFGYSADETYGGLSASDFPATIRPAVNLVKGTP